ncbi:hypothetical protein Pd630_LPD03178 [Rhodococcus opacus PD630]|nr:hypothetical protein Pd630_LPD03178 [Rhodococcus opacus PD630]
MDGGCTRPSTARPITANSPTSATVRGGFGSGESVGVMVCLQCRVARAAAVGPVDGMCDCGTF